MEGKEIERPIGPQEACEYLKVHKQTLQKYQRNGKIPKEFIHRLGRNVYYFKSELHQLLKQS